MLDLGDALRSQGVLSETRRARLPSANGEAHDKLWGALQAHAFFEDLLANKTQGHPKISVIVQSHQVDHSTPISFFLDLQGQGNFEGRHRN